MADRIILINGVRVSISYLRGGGGSVITTAGGDIIVLYGSSRANRPSSAVQPPKNCCPFAPGVEYMMVRLRMKREQMLYDLKNYAYIQHDLMEEQQKSVSVNGIDINHARHLTADIADDGNIDRVNRQLMLWYMDAVETLYPYTKTEPVAEDVDDVLTEPDEYIVEMYIPTTVSRTTIMYLSNLVHEYIVYRVLADWLSITDPQSSANWQTKAEEAKMNIERTKNLHTRPQTRKMSVF